MKRADELKVLELVDSLLKDKNIQSIPLMELKRKCRSGEWKEELEIIGINNIYRMWLGYNSWKIWNYDRFDKVAKKHNRISKADNNRLIYTVM